MSSASSSEAFATANYVRSVSIDRTRSDLVFLMFGVLVSAVPIARPVGALVALAGAIWYTNVAITVLVFSVLSSYVSPQLLYAYYSGTLALTLPTPLRIKS